MPLSTVQDDWDFHVSLACFRYNFGANRATGMSSYRAMLGIEPFMAWGPHEAKSITGEPYDLPNHLRDFKSRNWLRESCTPRFSPEECANGTLQRGTMIGRCPVYLSRREMAFSSGHQTW